jgi:hypothetical protein
LAEWFKERFGKSINQSTVSRNLKKFKASPPSKEPLPGQLVITPAKRERKGNASRTPPQKKIQITRLPPTGLSAVNLPPTPPPRENRSSPIDAALYDAYLNYRKHHLDATAEDCDRLIRAEARNLMANVRPGPSQEKLASPIIDDAWITNWKRVYGLLPPSIPASAAIPDEGQSGSEADRTCSEETEPRSPVSTVSSNDRPSHELSPNKGATGLAQPIPSSSSSSRPSGPIETPENKRNRQMEQLRKEIVKRDQRIEQEQRKKETALRKLEKLERAATTGAATQ